MTGVNLALLKSIPIYQNKKTTLVYEHTIVKSCFYQTLL